MEVIYRDESLVAINKPCGLLVHRSPIDRHETHFAVQMLRDQLGQTVYPIHRLDKPTSGVLLFALDSNTARLLSTTWGEVKKTYWAITRGYVENRQINHPITTKPDKGDRFKQPKTQPAQTHVEALSHLTINVGFGKSAKNYPNTTFSWVKAIPKTGRKHQIRKHLKHINHPIIGDTRYGRGEINRYFRETAQISRLMLHCRQIQFQHPHHQQIITITATIDEQWKRLLQRFPIDNIEEI